MQSKSNWNKFSDKDIDRTHGNIIGIYDGPTDLAYVAIVDMYIQECVDDDDIKVTRLRFYRDEKEYRTVTIPPHDHPNFNIYCNRYFWCELPKTTKAIYQLLLI